MLTDAESSEAVGAAGADIPDEGPEITGVGLDRCEKDRERASTSKRPHGTTPPFHPFLRIPNSEAASARLDDRAWPRRGSRSRPLWSALSSCDGRRRNEEVSPTAPQASKTYLLETDLPGSPWLPDIQLPVGACSNRNGRTQADISGLIRRHPFEPRLGSASSRSNPHGAHSSGVIRNVYRGLNRASSVRGISFRRERRCGVAASPVSRIAVARRRSHVHPVCLRAARLPPAARANRIHGQARSLGPAAPAERGEGEAAT
jgi:hypothetical protein